MASAELDKENSPMTSWIPAAQSADDAASAENTGHAALSLQMEIACDKACQAIAPAWPLDRAIAVNPHWSRIGMPVRRVAARMAR